MNRIFILFFAVAMFGFAACEQSPETTASEESEQVLEPNEPGAAEDMEMGNEVEEGAQQTDEELNNAAEGTEDEVQGAGESGEQEIAE